FPASVSPVHPPGRHAHKRRRRAPSGAIQFSLCAYSFFPGTFGCDSLMSVPQDCTKASCIMSRTKQGRVRIGYTSPKRQRGPRWRFGLVCCRIAQAVLMFAAIALAFCPGPAQAAESKPPNILYIMADDHAAHALSCYGSKINQTPNLDRIAH